MNYKKYFSLYVIFLVIMFLGCSAQESTDKNQIYSELYNRKPAVSGQFYPTIKSELVKNSVILSIPISKKEGCIEPACRLYADCILGRV